MGDTTAVYTSIPKISLSGREEAGLQDNLVAAVVEETIDGLYRCELVFSNFGVQSNNDGDYLYLGRDKLDFGKEITLRMGKGNPPDKVFTGRISALEAEYPHSGGSRLVVLAEDRLQDLRMTRRTRSFENKSDSDIIKQIAQDHGLSPQVSVNGASHKSVAQVNQSDLAFMRERARAVNAELWVEDKNLHAVPRTDRNGERVNLAYGISLLTFQVRADLAHQCTELTVSGWDVSAKDLIREKATSGVVSGELNSGTSGGSILEKAFGERKASIVHTVPLTGEEAKAMAEARYRERARRFVTGSGSAEGNARIRVGTILTLSELGKMFNGDYYVVRVRHTYNSAHGFRTEFDVERPGIR